MFFVEEYEKEVVCLNDTEKLGVLAIISQECSRRCLNWDIIEVKKETNFPTIIDYFLSNYDFLVLCGGAALQKFTESKDKINDYDLFICEEGNNYDKINSFLEKIKKNYDYYETVNAISIMVEKDCIDINNQKNLIKNYNYDYREHFHCTHKIQFIKRIYPKIEYILGGFDMDPCKIAFTKKNEGTFYLINTTELAIKTKINFINLNNQSKTYCTRIRKYIFKGFAPYNIYDKSNKMNFLSDLSDKNDYGIYISNECYFDRTKVINANIFYLLMKCYEKLFSTGEIYSLEDFLEVIEMNYNKHSNRYYASPINIKSKKIQKKYGVFYYTHEGKTYSIIENNINNKKLKEEYVKKRFYHYKNLTNLKLTNNNNNYSGKFTEINLNKELFCFSYRKVDFFKVFPELYFLLKNSFPKYIRYKICKDYVNTFISHVNLINN